jgi:hypothetical protein
VNWRELSYDYPTVGSLPMIRRILIVKKLPFGVSVEKKISRLHFHNFKNRDLGSFSIAGFSDSSGVFLFGDREGNKSSEC